MKKLFISCPMKGRTEEDIKKSMEKMHKMAELIFDQELEVIPTWIDEDAPEGTVTHGLWYLGESIKMLANADYYIGVECYDYFSGCYIENMAAREYSVRYTLVKMEEFMPDAVEILQKHYEEMNSQNAVTAYPKCG